MSASSSATRLAIRTLCSGDAQNAWLSSGCQEICDAAYKSMFVNCNVELVWLWLWDRNLGACCAYEARVVMN